MSEPMLTAEDAAVRLNLSTKTIHDLCERGSLPYYRYGSGRGTIRITNGQLDVFTKGCLV